jgi:RNA polymerase sigma-70 factor (ECF subfamily)
MAVEPLPERDDDAPVLARLATGDVAALGALYDRHQLAVRRFATRALSHHDDAEDVVQSTFLTAAKIATRYDGRRNARPWLIGIAARLIQQRSQRLARLARYLFGFAATRERSTDPRAAVEARSDLERLGRALSDLPARKRVVIVMAEIEGMSCAEIAMELGIPVGTVWTRLHHARKQLLEALQ